MSTDRAIAIRALDVMLHVHEDVRNLRAGFHLEIAAIKERLGTLESKRPPPSSARPIDDEPDEPSIHEWNQILGRAGHDLSALVKSPHNNIDSERARAIAVEVAQEVNRRALETAELTTWRRLKGLGPMMGRTMLKALVPFILGGGLVELWRWLASVR